jgi:hypothetical protein
LESKNLGLYRKKKYAKGKDMASKTAKNKKLTLQVGIKPSKGKNMGVPAQTIVSMLIEIVLNLIAELVKQVT